MHRIRTGVLTVVMSVAAALLAGVQPVGARGAAAVAPPSFKPPVALVRDCGSATAADATIAADGTVRGFITCGIWQAPDIWYFRYQAGTVFLQRTPYRGVIVKVAWDGLNSTYVLFTRAGPGTPSQQLVIGKHLETTGQYAPTTLLTTTYPAGLKKYLATIRAGLAAYRGRWWAVWTEPVGGFGGAGGEPVYSLFQRHTLLGVQPRTRMTYPSGQAQDAVPTLAYSSGLMTAVWLRGDPATGRGRLTLGLNTGHGWTARSLPATSPTQDPAGYPDLIQYVGTRHLAWLGSAAIGVASDVLDSFAPHLLPAPRPVDVTVAVSGQNLFLLWSWLGDTPGVRLAERQGGSWSQAVPVSGATSAVRVLAQGGRARLVYWSNNTLLLREQS